MTPPTLPTTLLLLLFASAAITGAHSQVPPEYPTTDGSVTFKPSIAIVVAIFSLMFSITFLLLMYAKFCHNIRRNRNNNGNGGDAFLLDGDPNRTSSGIDKTVIDSLPFFRFSALQGKRDGLECSVCLSKFSDAEILRLLPTCKHAFHVACIDRWLGSHSTCPLCRHRIDPADVAVSNRSSDANGLHLSLEREENLPNRKINDQDQELLHKHKHRVRVSGAVFKGRWSDLNSSDLVLLGSEMISSERFRNGTDSIGKITEEMGRKRALERRANEITVPSPSRLDWSFSREALLSQGDHKCMSDITGVTRFSDGSEDDDEVRRIWLPIARKTVRWFAGEERGRSELERTGTAQEAAFVSEV